MCSESAMPVHLLWTGGWDSTFQLLRLLLVHRQPVRPIYLVDEKRCSVEVEIRTMDGIRKRLGEHDPDTRALMLPTLYARVAELQPDPEIEDAFRRLQRKWQIGTQYSWLARFCRQRGLSDVEVGFEKARHGACALLWDLVVEGASDAGYRVQRLRPQEQHTDVGLVYGAYVFPVFDMTKQEMAREVDARGWRPIMLETWFCHRPVGNEPCARCNPCLHVISAGLGWRIPLRRRVLGTLHRATIGLAMTMARALVHKLRGRVPAAVPTFVGSETGAAKGSGNIGV